MRKTLKNLTPNRRGISTASATSFLFIFLVISIVFSQVSLSISQNNSIVKELQIDDERAKEDILLKELGTSTNNQFITYIRIMNTGEISVLIKGIYALDGNATTFLIDPSTYMDSSIEVNSELIITGPNGNYIASFDPNAKIELVTERGTKAIEYEDRLAYGTLSLIPNTAFSIEYGIPIQLNSSTMSYMKVNVDGTLIVNEKWHLGWNVNSNIGYMAWNISITNYDNRSLVLRQYSCLTIVPNESPPSQSLTWYIDPSNKVEKTQLLIPRQVKYLVFKWSTISDSQAQQLYNISPARYLLFITLYGYFDNEDGTTSPYSQTIPLDAALIVG